MRPRFSLLWVAFHLVLMFGPPLGADPLFPNQMVEVDGSPWSVVQGDFNADGRLDLAVANSFGDVSVLLGRGDGTFAPEIRYPVGDFPQSIDLGDFDGDGNPDLAVANAFSNDVSVLFGNVDGTFGPEVRLRVGGSPGNISVSDIDADGNPDLAVVNRVGGFYSGQPGSLSAFLGNGNGTFGSEIQSPAGVEPADLILEDVNGDGLPDAVVANFGTDTVSVFLGSGDGFFGPGTVYPVGPFPRSLAAGDLDGNGTLDLVATNDLGSCQPFDHTVSVLLGNGDGTFSPAIQVVTVLRPNYVVVADFTMDGVPDLAVSTGCLGYNVPDGGAILAGNGDGSFSDPELFGTGGYETRALSVGDFDADGSPDLVGAAPYSDNITVLLNKSQGSFGPLILRGVSPGSVAVADFNGDAIQDLVISNPDNSSGPSDTDEISVFLGLGNGAFGLDTRFEVGDQPEGIAVGDFNSDGNRDLAVANIKSLGIPTFPGDVSILLGSGDGSFGPDSRFGVGMGPRFPAVGDFNGDGKEDLVVPNLNSDDISILFGNGSGGFDPEIRIPVGEGPNSPVVADFNEDGTVDIAVHGRPGKMLLGDGSGGFPTVLDYPGESFGFQAGADLNGDGWHDLVTTPYRNIADVVSVLLGNGDGTLNLVDTLPTGNGPSLAAGVTIGDFNSDGIPDITVTGGFRAGDFMVYLGNGDGTFPSQHRFAIGSYSYPTSVAGADLNGDGRKDLAVAGTLLGKMVALVLNHGSFPATSSCFGFDSDFPEFEFTNDDRISLGERFWAFRDPDGNHGGYLPTTEVTGGVVKYRGGQGGNSDRLFIRREVPLSFTDWTLSGRFQYGPDGCASGDLFRVEGPISGFEFSIPQSNRVALNGASATFSTAPDTWYQVEVQNVAPTGTAEGRIWLDGTTRPSLPTLTTPSIGPLETIRIVGDNQCAPEGRVDFLCVGKYDCNDNGVDDLTDLATGTSQDCNANQLPDECEYDTDSDGVPDSCDACPDDPDKVAVGLCGCGLADIDTDFDGLLDCDDNCPKNPDPDQTNFDGDAGGDNCDPDDDGDNFLDALDCSLFDPTLWSEPGEVQNLTASDNGGTALSWSPPANPGATAPGYDTIRSADPFDFGPTAVCVESGDDTDTVAFDAELLSPGDVRYYLVRASTTCGKGTLGVNSAAVPRLGRSCP